MEDFKDRHTKNGLNRRDALKSGLLLAGGGLLMSTSKASAASSNAEKSSGINAKPTNIAGRRKLGKLEVSAIGLGVQNMSRTYQTTIPLRSEMHKIIRTAFDNGVTFFDAAEAYGPFEVEKILGEAIEPFRDKVVIATKFGWNIKSANRTIPARIKQ